MKPKGMSEKHLAAIFDVDGTLITGDSLERIFIRYLWRYGEIGWRDLARTFANGASEIITQPKSLHQVIASGKTYLRDKQADRIRRIAADCFEQQIKLRLLPAAIARLKWHQECGHQVMLLSGTLEMLIEPLAASLGVTNFAATSIQTRENLLTGQINGLHVYGADKLNCLHKALSKPESGIIDLSRSFAYGNSYADRYLLAATGNPVAANPDRRLRRFAEKRGWMIEDFTRSKSVNSPGINNLNGISDCY